MFASFGNRDNDPIIDKIIGQLSWWLDTYQPEKVYLQTDKPFYAAGDDIWFKAYVTVGSDHKLSGLSKVVNVELIDQRDSVIRWIKLPMIDGVTWGDIALSDTLKEGNYRIRAYTNWMRNMGSEYYYDKIVKIGSTGLNNVFTKTSQSKLDEKNTVTKAVTIRSLSGKDDVQFFPEGGYLVNGITSKLAFKAIGPDGFGTGIKGIVVDNENNKVCEFTTQHLGLGVFYITPQRGKTYKALITCANGLQSTVDLPLAQNSGYTLSVNESDSTKIRIKVDASNDIENSGNVYLLAQSGGQVYFVGKNPPGKTSLIANVPKNRFPSGIVQFTLFTNTGEPINERVVFIKNERDFLNLKISPDKIISAPRGKVKISLDVQSADAKPAIGSFSVSVIDENKVQTDENAATTILSHILLTSDIQGYIEQPNYYFINNDDTSRANLDILMLTQGYRRFEWKQLLAGEIPPPVYQPENLIKLSGYVKTTMTGKPVAAASIVLSSFGAESPFVIDTVADRNGHFVFKDLFLVDSLKFLLQAVTPKHGKNVVISLDDNGNEDKAIKNKYMPVTAFNSNTQLTNYLKAQKDLYDAEIKYGLRNPTRILKEVVIKGKKKSVIDHSDNRNGPGNADQVITSDELNCETDLTRCLEGRLAGVIIYKGQFYLTSNFANIALGGTAAAVMEIVVDGVPVTDLSNIPANAFSSVEVLKNITYTAIYGYQGRNGVLVLTTKRGPNKTESAPSGAMIYMPKGYYKSREFYSPHYDDPKVNKNTADLRTTIFWKPNIITDKDGHASFEYYNAGSPCIYHIIVEGIGIDGNLGYKTLPYKVE
ncbi:TonB-dependent receptor plug domain-containing protein [Mucilaginibacter sp. X5P1]|uniref:TonB-dependent receptor plug domain-containing protein n=1 Tax=Mucilaginibacter sp. X5P1 TaxID=2723088 RepID=UPI00161E9A3E|nr:TonB-dependent receptor plug domain-containing protein [Mucilaginibacter sp. X5P1]MBB6141466.1 hypothetical protein [Mucilaginibacter sp. X5P1]